LVQFLLPEHPDGSMLKTYLWNRHQKAFEVEWVNVRLMAE
jgi:hypothetical protein